jgi:hypothetical protein
MNKIVDSASVIVEEAEAAIVVEKFQGSCMHVLILLNEMIAAAWRFSGYFQSSRKILCGLLFAVVLRIIDGIVQNVSNRAMHASLVRLG